ncbi:hypothetical protein G6321_00039100 [Bradyrhizobium barranii subsp. barranii]|uniref:Uncharacterized protein n=1 Tax=Bradyrhizobium barranii subsp. barranii TaxID=2823807 RepID=A0A7Z0TSP1_9BRAD|nr:hypothetical protein [Bradyrhizobium barranii]UGX91714.1 hypothetical protein G6321_00039100 [Bradyrhizobium barranii subsp. barranii]
MDNDRVDVFVRRMAELASQLSELEILKDKVADAQQRALSSTIPSGALMKVWTKLIH